MAEQPSEETIIKLLEELRSDAAYRRMAVIKTIAEQRVDDERIVKILKTIVTEDMSDAVRGYAQAALYALEHGQLPPDAPWSTPVASKKERSPKEATDFNIGFFGMFAVNFLLWIISINIPGSFFPALVLLLNLGALVGFAFTRPAIASGMLRALAVAFGIVVVVGLFVGVVCLVAFS
ncbi:MAG: hypothetical protein HYZ49_06200 [Chloroflexi bacterium]|nr:hypothetical protein [Chloroflexota bacterium]